MTAAHPSTDHVVRTGLPLVLLAKVAGVVLVLGIAAATVLAIIPPTSTVPTADRPIAGGPPAYASAAGHDRPVEPPLGIPTARPRIVELYQDHCPACQATKARVDRLRRDCAGRQVEILAINTDDARNAGLREHLGVEMVPTFILLDDQGQEAGRLVGAPELADLRRAAASLLGQTCAGHGPVEETDGVAGRGCVDVPARAGDEGHDPHPLLLLDEPSCQG